MTHSFQDTTTFFGQRIYLYTHVKGVQCEYAEFLFHKCGDDMGDIVVSIYSRPDDVKSKDNSKGLPEIAFLTT